VTVTGYQGWKRDPLADGVLPAGDPAAGDG
jgi:hypothetical protein